MNKCKQNVYPFPSFPTYLEIKIYLGELCRTYPHLCSIEIIGITSESAEIYMLKMQKNPCDSRSQARDIIFVDAVMHAREWLTCSTAIYIINYIILHDHVLDNTNYYIIPCINVDGYLFSQRNKCYRLWRKNRTLNCSSDVALQGVDLNRNFPIGFAMPGSSDDPGSYNYRGEEPLSEPASRAVSFALNKYRKCIKLYISLHCYGNAILYPWSFTKEPICDCADLENCGLVGQQAILKASCGNRRMRVGNSAMIMNLAAGTSTDYARYVHGIKFCYIYELQGYGTTGFTPDKKHIPQIGYETMMGIFAMARYVHKFFRNKKFSKTANIIIEDDDDCEDGVPTDDDESPCKCDDDEDEEEDDNDEKDNSNANDDNEDEEDDDDDDEDGYEEPEEPCKKPCKRKRKRKPCKPCKPKKKCVRFGKISVEAGQGCNGL